MRVLRVGEAGAERPAVLDGSGRLLDASGIAGDLDHRTLADGVLDRIAEAAAAGTLPVLADRADGLRIGAPVARPGKIVCIGLNYRDHAEETERTSRPSRSSS